LIWATLAGVLLFFAGGITAGGYVKHQAPDPAQPAVDTTPAAVAPTDVQPEPAAVDVRKAELQRLMVKGNASLAQQRFPEALRLYEEAQKLFPGDVDAAKGISATRAALADKSAKTATVAEVAPPAPTAAPTDVPRLGLANVPQIIVDPQIGYEQLMNQAAVAMLNGRYDQASECYSEALQLAPQAEPALASADNCLPPWAHASARAAVRLPFNRRGLPAGPANGTAFNGLKRAGYFKAMAEGDAAMRAQNYGEAVKDFQDALRKMPNDTAAASALTQAEALAL
jgi:tetratricopeptide (TPR) repeat protein